MTNIPICSGAFEVEVETLAWRLRWNISFTRLGRSSLAAWSHTHSSVPVMC